jgi:N,N-dimethylformamidase
MTSLWVKRTATAVALFAFVVVAKAQRAERPAAPAQEPAAARPPNPWPSSEEAISTRMGIVGYGDHLSIQPGQTIKFMVSSQSPTYHADIVRLIHGDPNPKGPGIKEQVVSTPTNADYPGKKQILPLGSYVRVPDAPPLRLAGSFTITAWIAPTRHTSETRMPTPSVQGILAKWSPADQTGYGLFLDEGRLSLWIGGPRGSVDKFAMDAALRPWSPSIPGARNPRPQGVSTQWYFVAATFDAATGRVSLYQEPETEFPFDAANAVLRRTRTSRSVSTNAAPLLIGASWIEKTAPGATGHYNGKIDNPQIYARAMSQQELQSIRKGKAATDAVGAWDFSKGMATDLVVDVSGKKLNGRAVNFPTRAVTGHNWTGKEMDFRRAPNQYGAIYFHDDDLEDAKWDVGFSFKVPDNLKSGIYAARLRTATAEDYVPFFVRPKKGTATAKIAFLVPTFSYLAYGGTGGGESTNPGAGGGNNGPRLMSLYAHHSDGPGFTYSSRLRPITNMRPKLVTRNPWQFMADTHLVDWLDVKGFAVDVFTDEDLHFEGAALLKPYKVVLTGTHPEYTSPNEHDALHSYLDHGGRVMYLGGNGFYWVTIPDPKGRFVEVRRRDGTEAWQGAPGESHHSLTGEPGGLWRFRGHPPQEMVGVGFTAQGFDRNSPYKRTEGSFDPRAAFIFEGVGQDELIGDFPSMVLEYGAAGSELDRADYAIGTPPHTLILAKSYGHSDAYQHVVEEVNTSDSRQGGTVNPLVYANLVYLEYPNGGAVFSTGSIAWCGSLSYENYTNNVSRITENVLRRFMGEAPIPAASAVPLKGTE